MDIKKAILLYLEVLKLHIESGTGEETKGTDVDDRALVVGYDQFWAGIRHCCEGCGHQKG